MITTVVVSLFVGIITHVVTNEINKSEIRRLRKQNRDLEDQVYAEKFERAQQDSNANFWRKMYQNTIKRANGQEPENLVK